MLNCIRTGGLLGLLIILAGCATVAQGPAYSESKAAEVKPGYALVYVFREYAEPTMWGATIHIDDKEVSTLNQGGFTWVYAKTYYVDLTGISQLAGATLTHMYFRVGSGLNGVNVQAAEPRLEKCCKFQKPSNTVY